jgi:hypothetical protein
MKKKLTKNKPTLPVLSLRLQVKRGCLTIQLAVRARWLAAACIALAGLLLSSDTLSRLHSLALVLLK